MPDLTTLQSNGLDAATTAWLVELLEVIETLDADAYAARMSEDVVLRLPGGATLDGRTAVADGLRGAWSATRSLVHHETHLQGDARRLVHESRVVSTDRDGAVTTTHSTAWIERDADGRLTSARVYG